MSKILVLVGSLRAGSVNRQLAHTATEIAPEGVELTVFDGIAQLPFYNEDIDVAGATPIAAVAFRDAIAESDAILILTPEYNGTMPAVLKNAIDWASRPMGESAIMNKPVAVIGSAYGQFGGVWAQDEARKALGISGARVLEDAKLSIAGSVVRFAELHPRQDTEVVGQLTGILAALNAAIQTPAAA